MHKLTQIMMMTLLLGVSIAIVGCDSGGDGDNYSDNSRFHGSYSGVWGVTDSEPLDFSWEIGSDLSRKYDEDYLYIPFTETNYTNSGTNDGCYYSEKISISEQTITFLYDKELDWTNQWIKSVRTLTFDSSFNSFTNSGVDLLGTSTVYSSGIFTRD
ncbi:MAG: hypothetical protein PF692_01985 [Kiritimatiellae bacterium]|nr:hypothetical protein [Kiritimatiellia bacterium]